jgi:hypothetical protein
MLPVLLLRMHWPIVGAVVDKVSLLKRFLQDAFGTIESPVFYDIWILIYRTSGWWLVFILFLVPGLLLGISPHPWLVFSIVVTVIPWFFLVLRHYRIDFDKPSK